MSMKPSFEEQAWLGLALGSDMGDVVVDLEGNRATAAGQMGDRRWHLARKLDKETKKALLEVGFTFPGESEDDKKDDILVPVMAPIGWKIERSNGMWSYLVDSEGRKRGELGYKGACWDRWASTGLFRRYGTHTDHSDSENVPGGMPPEIAALQVMVKVEKPRPEPKVQHDGYGEGYSDGYLNPRFYKNRYGDPHEVFFMDPGFHDIEPTSKSGRRKKPKPPPPIEYEEKIKNTFDPHNNAEHRALPYKRYAVEDRVTGTRIWTGPWLTVDQVINMEVRGKNDPSLTGETWLNENFPDWKNPVAYW